MQSLKRSLGASAKCSSKHPSQFHIPEDKLTGIFQSGHNKEIYDLAWSPCGEYFITASIDNTARVWSVAQSK